MESIVLHIAFIFTRSSRLYIGHCMLDCLMCLHTLASAIGEYTMSCFEWSDRQEYLDTVWDKMKRQTSIDDEVIFLCAEIFLSIIEDRIDDSSISLCLSSEIDERDASLECEPSHEVSCRVFLVSIVLCETSSECTFACSMMSSKCDDHRMDYRENIYFATIVVSATSPSHSEIPLRKNQSGNRVTHLVDFEDFLFCLCRGALVSDKMYRDIPGSD